MAKPRALRPRFHPDIGGSAGRFLELSAARDALMQER
jgi:hypothetical protein